MILPRQNRIGCFVLTVVVLAVLAMFVVIDREKPRKPEVEEMAPIQQPSAPNLPPRL